jgi:hypothetical protein
MACGNGRKPVPSYLSPAEAEYRLRQILAGAPRRPTRTRPGSGRRFMDVAEDWMLHGERKRGLKQGTLRDYRYTLDGHLLPAFGNHEIAAFFRPLFLEPPNLPNPRLRSPPTFLPVWAPRTSDNRTACPGSGIRNQVRG